MTSGPKQLPNEARPTLTRQRRCATSSRAVRNASGVQACAVPVGCVVVVDVGENAKQLERGRVEGGDGQVGGLKLGGILVGAGARGGRAGGRGREHPGEPGGCMLVSAGGWVGGRA
jgi:hypothetical protein